VPLIWELARVCGEEAGGYVHWGATTQNITQTGQLLLLRQAHKIFIGQLGRILSVMADLAERTKDMALPGRTHGQHAVPATFGFKVGNWIDELCRHVERFREAEPRVFVAMLGGAAGTFASFGNLGPKIQAGMAVHLDMKPMSAPARTIGDHQAEYVCLLGMLASTCSKVAREIYTQMKQEFGEVEEPVPPGTVGSSTMPQKRNPKLTQDMVAAAAQVRALVPLALEAMQTEHEADRTTSLMISHALQDACGQTGDILSRMETMLEGLQVNEARMRQNLDLSGGLIMGEALMLSLGANIGRQEAHDAIYEAAQAAATTDETFQSLLAKDDTVRAHMSTDQIAELLDPTAYTGQCAAIAIEQAARAREVAKRLEGIAS
jgi:adenylosuccinate lyase